MKTIRMEEKEKPGAFSVREYFEDFRRPAKLLRNTGVVAGVALAASLTTSCTTAQPAFAQTPRSIILRLYGPLEPFFSKTWRPGETELIK